MRIDNGIDTTYWELDLIYEYFIKDNINWGKYFKTLDEIEKFIHESFIGNGKNYDVKILDNLMYIIITVVFNKQTVEPKMEIFVLKLKTKKYDSELMTMKFFEQNLKNLNKTFAYSELKVGRTEDPINLIKILEDKVINDIEVKVNQLESNFNKQLSDITTNLSDKNKYLEDEITTAKKSLKEYFNMIIDEKFGKLNNEMKEIKESSIKNNETLSNFIIKFNEMTDDHIKKSLMSNKFTLRTYFNSERSINCDLFNFNKTIRVTPFEQSPFWYGYIFTDKVFERGITEINFRVDKTDESLNFILGFTDYNTLPNNGYWQTNTSWMFNFQSGSFYNPGFSNREKDCYISNKRPVINDIITLCFDSISNEFIIKINGELCSKKSMSLLNQNQKSNLYPCVDIYNVFDYQFSLV